MVEPKKDLNKYKKIQTPFLKWVGGKTQIIENIISKIPQEINNYHEPFLGGGSVLLAILTLQKDNKIKIKNKIYASDINSSLINVYNQIKKNKDELYKSLKYYLNEYDKLDGKEINRNPNSEEEAKSSKESYYYWIRKKYNSMNKDSIESAALFIFINKTCFRGMYREGPNGYNVPYGHYKKTPNFITEQEITSISNLIQNVEFTKSNFKESLERVKKGDFVYLDPPYAPVNNKSFVNYVADGFNLESHKLLFNSIKKINNIKFLMSNAKVELVVENFKEYNCENILARRAINSKNPESTALEVLIYNY